MVEFLVTQDRDQIIPFKPTSSVNIVSAYYEDIYYGENLIIDNTLTGTFETYEKAKTELMNIYNSNDEIYGIDGYSDYIFALEQPEPMI